MPSYTVYNADGGTTTVNAKNLQSALGNVPGSTASPPSAPAKPSQQTSAGAGPGAPAASGDAGTNFSSGSWSSGPGGSIQSRTYALMANGMSASDAYAQASREAGSSAGGGGGGGGGGSSMGGDYANQWAADLAMQNAQNAATQAYNNAKLRLETDAQAFAQAQQAFANEITKAGLTGRYQGAPTQAALQYGANTFGTWGVPTGGQTTLAAQKQASDLQAQWASMFGQYYGPGGGPPVGTPTQAAAQQQFAQQQALANMYGQAYSGFGAVPGGQTTLAAQQQTYDQWLNAQKQALSQWTAQQSAAQNYLTMMAGLRGPADWAQYQKVLGATPQGMQDLVRAAAGQYIPGGGATTGVAPTPVSLQNFVGGVTGGATPQDQAAMSSLVAPNQMAPQTWNNLTPSQQQMLLGTWESQGYSKDDAQNLFKQSLPRYGGMAPTAGTFRLQ